VTIKNSVFVKVTSPIFRVNTGGTSNWFLRNFHDFFLYHSIVCIQLSYDGNNKSGTEGTVKERTNQEHSNQDERTYVQYKVGKLGQNNKRGLGPKKELNTEGRWVDNSHKSWATQLTAKMILYPTRRIKPIWAIQDFCDGTETICQLVLDFERHSK